MVGNRSGFDPFGTRDVTIDDLLGTAYKNVQILVDNIGIIQKMSEAFDVDNPIIPNVGVAGKSAYQTWLDLGNTGNQQAFINSLKGANATSQQINDAVIAYIQAHPNDFKGNQGVSITGASINSNGHLILTLSSGSPIDAGALPTSGGGSPTPTPTPTPTPSASTPQLALKAGSDPLAYSPQLTVSGLDDSVHVGDTLRLEYSHDVTFNTGVTIVDRVLNAVPSGNNLDYNLTDITSGTNRFHVSIYRGGARISDWSQIVTHGPDDLAPVLSNPTAVTTGTTTATVGATTDTGEGTMYFVLVPTNAQPTKAQIKAGQNAAGTSAAKAATYGPNSSGIKSVNITGLNQNSTYYTFIMHEDVAGNQSNIVAAASFTTEVAPPFAISETAAPAVVLNPPGVDPDNGVYDYIFEDVSIGTANSTRKLYICVEFSNGGGTLTGVSADNANATKLSDTFYSTQGFIYEIAKPTGTTADIRVRTASPLSHVSIKVWRCVGGGTPTIVSNGGTYDEAPFKQTTTVPNGGGVIAFAAQISSTINPTWTNATPDSLTRCDDWSFFSAHTVTAGLKDISYVGQTGFPNYLQSFLTLVVIPPA